MKAEMENVWQHFCSVVGPDLRELHVPSSSHQGASLDKFLSEILTIAGAIKDNRKVRTS